MADTYTRDQIVRRLRNLKKQASEMMEGAVNRSYFDGKITAYSQAIAAFPPKKEGSK